MFNFKRNSSLFIVHAGNKYPVELYPDITFSQRFQERSLKEKNLHRPNNLHDSAIIQTAEEGALNFTTALRHFSQLPIFLDLGVSFSGGTIDSFDVYVVLDNITYKLEKCIISRLTFNLTRNDIVTVSVQISFSKKSLFEASIPGILQALSTNAVTPIVGLDVQINSTVLENIAGISVEVANEYKWLEHSTMTSGISYPTEYVIGSRTVSGAVIQYLLDTNEADFSDSGTDSTLDIAVTGYSGSLMDLALPSIVYTRRLNVDELISRAYDFRLNTNSGNAVSIIT